MQMACGAKGPLTDGTKCSTDHERQWPAADMLNGLMARGGPTGATRDSIPKVRFWRASRWMGAGETLMVRRAMARLDRYRAVRKRLSNTTETPR